MTKYSVVRQDNGPNNPSTGLVSRHRSVEAAQKAIDRANQRLRKLPGQHNSWHPYAIMENW